MKNSRGTHSRKLLDPVIAELIDWASQDTRRYNMLVCWFRRTRLMLVMRSDVDLARQVVFDHDSGRSLDAELNHRETP